MLTFGGLLTWVERKQSAVMQDRIGANRADILGFRLLGLFHIMTDGIKMFTKEEFIPARRTGDLHSGPFSLLVFSPCWRLRSSRSHPGVTSSDTFSIQIANPDIGLLFVFAMMAWRFTAWC